MRMHHRFTQSLEVKFLYIHKLVNDMDECFEIHEGRRSEGRAIFTKLNRAHLTAKLALPNWLHLHVGRQLHTCSLPSSEEYAKPDCAPQAPENSQPWDDDT